MKSYTQQFQEVFRSLTRSHGRWEVWSEFITMSACALAQRETQYQQIVKRHSADEVDKLTQLFAFTALALEENPDQDFLGETYCRLELSDKRSGQFFTPYNVAKMMAIMQCGDLAAEIKQKGRIFVNDCCCGAGALLIAFANAAQAQGVNYSRDVEFVAQDIDPTVAKMCYIQLSLLGCTGYVIVGDSLSPDPPEPEKIWLMPMSLFQQKKGIAA